MRRAQRIFHRKRHYDDGTITELTLWLVPQPVCRPGERLILYDNEPGKGDHRHYVDREEPYLFSTPEQLIRDFVADVRNLRRRNTSGDD